jgi:hypothetical protein
MRWEGKKVRGEEEENCAATWLITNQTKRIHKWKEKITKPQLSELIVIEQHKSTNDSHHSQSSHTYTNAIGAKLQHLQVGKVLQILDFGDFVVLQEETLQLSALLQTLDDPNLIVRQIQPPAEQHVSAAVSCTQQITESMEAVKKKNDETHIVKACELVPTTNTMNEDASEHNTRLISVRI